MKTVVQSLAIALFVFIHVACGSSDFISDGKTTQTASELDSTPGTQNSKTALNLDWSWNCSDSSLKSNASSLAVERNGLVDLPNLSKTSKVSLAVDLELCEQTQNPSKIVFYVDVSGSMASSSSVGFGSDPIVNGTCGRLDAIRGIMNKNNRSTEYAIVTFSSSVDAKSSGFFRNEDELTNDFSVEELSEVVCDGTFSTNFESLSDVQDLFDDFAEANDFKHVFMISDGQPNSPEENGMVAAEALKSNDVVIATTYIGNDKSAEQVLMDIASLDSDGKPLHSSVGESGELVDAIETLIVREITGAYMDVDGLSPNSSDPYSIKLDVNYTDLTVKQPIIEDLLGLGLLNQDLTATLRVVYSNGDEETKSGRIQWN